MIKIEIPILEKGEILPEKYTCDGKNVNPPILLENFHPKAKSFVLIMEDLDALFGFSSHWLVWNISSETKKISEDSVPEEAMVGLNSFNENRYYGPCSRLGGSHRYLFTVYALDIFLKLPSSSRIEELEKKMTNHLLDEGKITVLYRKKFSPNSFLDSI